MRAYFERDLERRLGAPPLPPPPAEGAKVRYQVMTSVPENWIPTIPVHPACSASAFRAAICAMTVAGQAGFIAGAGATAASVGNASSSLFAPPFASAPKRGT
jgi:hypothetical protein